ncbi:MAG: OmpA family protein [Archangiaceae bacterium]|nr:OmpA family protein [Archangiaceae bacterium]
MVALFMATVASAQATTRVPSFDLERLTFNPAARESLWASTGDVLLPRDWRVALTMHYEHDPLVYRTASRRVGAVVGSRFTAHLMGAYALFWWLELGAQVPVVLYQSGDDLTGSGVARPKSFAMGTPWVQARFGVLQESRGAFLDLALHLGVGLPIGTRSGLASDLNVSFEPRVGAGKKLGPVRIGADLGVQLRDGFNRTRLSPFAVDGVHDEVGSRLALGLVVTTTNVGLRGELGTRIDVPFSRTGSAAEVLAGGRYAFANGVELHLLGALGFGTLPGIPSFRLAAGVSYGGLERPATCPDDAPATQAGCDFDRDGVLNEVDACNEVPGLQKFDGCPDTDGDGLPDAKDHCPEHKGPIERMGCPRVDTDGDGLTDDVDACPGEPGTRELKGCPVRDTDGDGIPDPDDGCVTEPGTKENKGCPVKDTDRDGIPDPEDSCVNEPGDAAHHGCPLRDTDGDGVTDELDNCPNEPGPKENQGCKKRQLVEITREKLLIKEQVLFESGKAVILPRSFGMLDQVADVLRSHAEVKSVRIEGHTDSRGKRESNVALSQRRADAVKAYLVGRGVEASRLWSVGYGPDMPLDSNATDAGRQRNRRVEFVIETGETTRPK